VPEKPELAIDTTHLGIDEAVQQSCLNWSTRGICAEFCHAVRTGHWLSSGVRIVVPSATPGIPHPIKWAMMNAGSLISVSTRATRNDKLAHVVFALLAHEQVRLLWQRWLVNAVFGHDFPSAHHGEKNRVSGIADDFPCCFGSALLPATSQRNVHDSGGSVQPPRPSNAAGRCGSRAHQKKPATDSGGLGAVYSCYGLICNTTNLVEYSEPLVAVRAT